MANKRLQQLFVLREDLPGVLASGLVAAANGKIRVKDPVMTPANDTYEREILYGSLSALTPLIGKTDVDISFGVELSGSTNGTTAPVWAPLLEACGMRQVAIKGGSWSGGMGGTAIGVNKRARHGDLWTVTGGAKVIRIIHDTFVNGSAVADSRMLYYEEVTGSVAANDVFFPAGSDATVGPTITLTGGAPDTAKGYAWYPISVPTISCTLSAASGTNAADNIYIGVTSRATLQAISTPSATTGIVFRLLDGTPVAGEQLANLTNVGSNVTIDASTPAFAQPNIPTLSMALGQDGRILVAKGCRGTFKLTAEKGKIAFLEFRFKGGFSAAQNGGSISGIEFESKTPPRILGTGFLLASHKSGEVGYLRQDTMVTPTLESFEFDLGSEANLEEDATQSTGTTGIAHITGVRKAQGKMKIGTRTEASWPVITKLVASEAFGIKVKISDPATSAQAANQFLLSAPGCKATGVGATDTNNLLRDDVTFALSGLFPPNLESADRELVLSYHHTGTVNW